MLCDLRDEPKSAVMKDLETSGTYNNSTNKVGYQAGTYSHGLKENDSLQLNGTFTFIWEREQSDEWKLTVISIAQRSQEADPHPEETPGM